MFELVGTLLLLSGHGQQVLLQLVHIGAQRILHLTVIQQLLLGIGHFLGVATAETQKFGAVALPYLLALGFIVTQGKFIGLYCAIETKQWQGAESVMPVGQLGYGAVEVRLESLLPSEQVILGQL